MTVGVLSVGVMIVGVLSLGVMTVGVLSVGVVTLSRFMFPCVACLNSFPLSIHTIVTDSLCNSGAFSNPNAVRDCPFNLKGAWFLSQSRKFFSYAALLFLKLFSAAHQNIFYKTIQKHGQ
jgi:hypothetical protein